MSRPLLCSSIDDKHFLTLWQSEKHFRLKSHCSVTSPWTVAKTCQDSFQRPYVLSRRSAPPRIFATTDIKRIFRKFVPEQKTLYNVLRKFCRARKYRTLNCSWRS